MRCHPAPLSPKFSKRPLQMGGMKVEPFHNKLHGAFIDQASLSIALPSLMVLETFLDGDPLSAEARETKDAAELVMAHPLNALASVLLSREQGVLVRREGFQVGGAVGSPHALP